MWIRKIGLGILIGVVLCSVMVNAEERNSRKAEPMTVMERMREIPHKIYGKKKSRNKMRKDILDRFIDNFIKTTFCIFGKQD